MKLCDLISMIAFIHKVSSNSNFLKLFYPLDETSVIHMVFNRSNKNRIS